MYCGPEGAAYLTPAIWPTDEAAAPIPFATPDMTCQLLLYTVLVIVYVASEPIDVGTPLPPQPTY